MPQRRVDPITAELMELIRNLGFALDAAVLGAMYLTPAQYAEPHMTLQKCARLKLHLMRALHIVERVANGPALKRQQDAKRKSL